MRNGIKSHHNFHLLCFADPNFLGVLFPMRPSCKIRSHCKVMILKTVKMVVKTNQSQFSNILWTLCRTRMAMLPQRRHWGKIYISVLADLIIGQQNRYIWLTHASCSAWEFAGATLRLLPSKQVKGDWRIPCVQVITFSGRKQTHYWSLSGVFSNVHLYGCKFLKAKRFMGDINIIWLKSIFAAFSVRLNVFSPSDAKKKMLFFHKWLSY